MFIFIALLDCHFYSLHIAAAATSGRDKCVGLLLVVSLTRAGSRARDAHYRQGLNSQCDNIVSLGYFILQF